MRRRTAPVFGLVSAGIGRAARPWDPDVIDIPEELAATQIKYGGDAGREFIAALPQRAADFLERWELRQTGRPMHGWCALVLPVERPDGTTAALKLAAEQVSIGRILLAQRAGRQAG